MILLTRQQLADLRHCHVSTVSKAGLPQAEGKKYDLADPEVWEWVTAPAVETAIREQSRKTREGMNVDGAGYTELEEEKLREDIEWKRRQSRKLDREHETAMENLIPAEMIAIWIGHFAAGIRTNFLNIGNRIARGDVKLRDRIEKEIKKAIEKTLGGAEKGLEKESAQIVKALEEKWQE